MILLGIQPQQLSSLLSPPFFSVNSGQNDYLENFLENLFRYTPAEKNGRGGIPDL